MTLADMNPIPKGILIDPLLYTDEFVFICI